jgi:hypothetical protein
VRKLPSHTLLTTEDSPIRRLLVDQKVYEAGSGSSTSLEVLPNEFLRDVILEKEQWESQDSQAMTGDRFDENFTSDNACRYHHHADAHST